MIVSLDGSTIRIPAPADVISALRTAFAGLTDGSTVQPDQTVLVLPGEKGDCIFYPSYLESAGVIGIKASPYLIARSQAAKSPVTAYTLLLDAETGEPTAIYDSLALTTERTAATTLLASQLILAGSEVQRVGIVGSGAIARAHGRYASALWPEAAIAFYSPGAGNRRDAILADVPAAEIATNLDEATSSAELVLLCTSSPTPVLDPIELDGTLLVTSISTNGPDAHEIPPQRLTEMQVYCDYRETCPTTAADMRLAIAEGWSAKQIVADLPELLTGRQASVGSGQTSYFRSTGLGMEDIAIANLLLDQESKSIPSATA